MKNLDVSDYLIRVKSLDNIDYSKALNKAGILVENSAKENVPVDTGQLRQSITHELNGTKEVDIGTNLEYAPYVEFGTGLFSSEGTGRQDVPWRYQDAEGNWHTTSGIKPQPYLKPAVRKNKKRIVEVISKELKGEINGRCK